MQGRLLLNTAFRFLHTLRPASAWQLLPLTGAILLLCAPFMPWWVNPQPPDFLLEIFGNPKPETDWPLPRQVLMVGEYFVMASALAALVLCFRDVRSSRRFFLIWVLPFSIPAIALNVLDHLFSRPINTTSVLDSSAILSAPVRDNLASLFSHLGPGLYTATAGLILVGTGAWANRKKGSVFPLAFAERSTVGQGSSGREILRFVLVVLVLGTLLTTTLPFLSGLVLHAFPLAVPTSGWTHRDFIWIKWMGAVLVTLPVTAAALWFLRGKGGWKGLFPPFPPKYLLIAAGLPLLALAVPRLLAWVVGEIQHHFWALEYPTPPGLDSLFVLPPAWALIALLPAFMEEIGWRGYLQPRMVAEFGLRRGLLLVGIAWAVWHLPGDVSRILRPDYLYYPWFVLEIFTRLIFVLLHTVPMGWLFWRTGSVIPVTVMHGAFNAFHQGDQFLVQVEYGWLAWFEVGILGLAGLWLFKQGDPFRKKDQEPENDAGGEATSSHSLDGQSGTHRATE